MVMKRNAMRRNLRQSIIRSMGRYIAIASIIALGAGLFLGLLMTKTDMVATGQQFMDKQNMFDIRLISTYGWSQKQLDQVSQLDWVEEAEGIFYRDLVARYNDRQEDSVYRFYMMPERINQISLQGGRMPEQIGECLADGFHTDDSILGKKILISRDNGEDDLETVKLYQYTVVGYVSSPLYMDMNRGTTSVGNGSLEGYFYLPQDSFHTDYFTEIHVTLPEQGRVYTDEYNTLLEDKMEAIEPLADQLGAERFRDLKAEAEEEYRDGYQEYLDGVSEFEEGKAEAEQELADAYQELIDGEQEIEDTQWELENAERDLYNAKVTVTKNLSEVKSGRKTLQAAKAKAEAKKPELDAGKAQLEASGLSLSEIAALPDKISGLEKEIARLNDVLLSEADEAKREELSAMLSALQTQKAQLEALSGYAGQAQSILDGYSALNQLYAREKELDAAKHQLEEALEEIQLNITKVYNGYEDLKEARQEIADGWKDYYEGKAEAEQEIADAQAELDDARLDLAQTREDIDSMEEPDVIILDRNSNPGYSNLDGSSDIVQGVSRVFPVFFLLIASLVCITTMTRMIDEERTQIGTLKALGYTNREIMSKYLLYAGSSAVIGCGLGILAGSTLFPVVIWEAYKIMLHIQPNIVLTVNWPLGIAVAAIYTATILSVTWYCCHKTLEEVPAELIRPKAPDAGKAMFFEKLALWNRVSFLNKVTVRNVFRYRQRMAMMLVGIGGCTALLVTGFGLRDSIVNVVDYQFLDVTQYDLEVYFREELTPQAETEFLGQLEPGVDHLIYHQSSIELEYDHRVKEVMMISAGEELAGFIHMHRGADPVSMPGEGEAVLTVGVAEAMGISIGDTVTFRDPDMRTMDLRVSGIYDNHVDNYAIVLPQTVESQWNMTPEQKMAYVILPDEVDAHEVGAAVSDLKTVMNVSVSEDVAATVKNMMEALDLVIVLVVFCAGLLAVTVLYNLTNININERIREIATIKVLGFNASETSAYVFKENMVLTVAGSVLGLGLGYILLLFVMSQVKIDMVWFKAMIMPESYVYAILLTLLAAICVNFVFYFKLQKVNMAEALKSVE